MAYGPDYLHMYARAAFYVERILRGAQPGDLPIEEAVKLATEQEPDLVLADIQLADGSSGVDAASDILNTLNIPVIFITAFPECLLTGERLEPTYLIAKPFLRDTVKATIGQALFFHKPAAVRQPAEAETQQRASA